ncbi:SusC/RagA family TonB-linked outer membrane protein [Sphingobacterium suaedae]|uniref:SusC/RagA family TonB-linked outer membrane protein n=1 Tax=Sphingobacterium suaedae TaxID=1686402 RepID=A0ABW5KIH3_9SPHI
MKLSIATCCFFYVVVSSLYANTLHAQKLDEVHVNLSDRSLTIDELLRQVQEQSALSFMYNPKEIKSQRRVQLTNRKLNGYQLLSLLKEQLAISYRIDGNALYLERRQTPGIIKGKVYDQSGNVLIGATVNIEGTSQTVQTSEDGSYSMRTAPGNIVLTVSYIGYQTRKFNIQLREAQELSFNAELEGAGLIEEITVSYGKQKRLEVTGAINQIDATALQDMPVTQFAQQLQGRAPGVQIYQTSGQPGRGMSWRIRGAASLNSGSSPLFVVDGMPITGSINNINPNEIESFSILKDASATALYGSRASNGVILITTRKAKPSEGTKIDFNANYGIQSIPSRGVPAMMTARQYATFMKERFEDMIRYEDFKGTIPEEYQNPDQYGEGTNWFKLLTRTAPQHNYDISLSSAKENSTTMVIGGYQHQEGVVVNSGTKLFSIRANQSYRLLDSKLRIGVNLAPSYRLDHNNRLEDGIQGIVQKTSEASPLIAPYDESGAYTRFVSSPGMVSYINPLARYELTVDDYKTSRLLGNAYIDYQVLDGLKVSGLAGVDMGREMRQYFVPSFLNTNNISSGTSSSLENYSYTAELNLNYDKTFGNHHLDALVGYSVQSFRQASNTVSGQNFASDEIPYLNVAANITGGSSNSTSYALLSYLGRINYSYKDRYLVAASVRRDGSSRFGKNEQYGTFPAFSAGWILSKERFLETIAPLNLLKLRASYGFTGNNNIGNYTHIPQIGNSNYVINGELVQGSTVTTLGNTYLAWEKTRQLDVGLDISLWNDKLTFTYDYYNKLSDGLIQARPIDRASGFASITSNVGAVKFWGHELSIGTQQQFGELHWISSFNMSFDRNRIQRLVSPGYIRRFNNISSDYYRNQEGYPLGMFFGFIHEGLIKDEADLQTAPKYNKIAVGTIKMRDLNGDGLIDENDRTFIGDPNPDFLFGFHNQFQYKNIDVSFSMAGSYGGKLILPAKWAYLTNMDGARAVLAEAADRWRSEDNPGSGKYPRTLSGTTAWGRNVNSQWVEDGSYLAMKNITIGYHIPAKNTWIRNVRAYASIQNVFYVMSYSGMNPEISLNGLEGASIGIDENAYPVPRIFSLGFNLTLN